MCKNGVDFTLPAYIYLITNNELQAHKIGIGGEYANQDRLLDHTKQGWTLYKKNFYHGGQGIVCGTVDIEMATR